MKIYNPDFTRSYTETEAREMIAAGTHKLRTPPLQEDREALRCCDCGRVHYSEGPEYTRLYCILCPDCI